MRFDPLLPVHFRLRDPMILTRHKTILVVEDERLVAKDLQRTLSSFGYLVPSTASSADEAIRLASERCPDLVLMDIRIKGQLDGIETAKILRHRFDVPVVYLTASADDETVARAKVTEPYGYLLKPVKDQELRGAVEIALYKHQMERRLREREQWFATALRSIGDAVISTDARGNVTFMNPVAEVLTGWRSEEASGRPLADILRLVDELTKTSVANPIERALREGKVVELNAHLVPAMGMPREGQERVIADSAAPIIDDAGEVVGAVLVFRDLSEQRRMQRQLELADRMASLGTMAAGVAHEVNNPLMFVLANLQFAIDQIQLHQSGPQAPWLVEVKEALSEAKTGAERVRQIVSDLRSFSRPAVAVADRADVPRVLGWSLKMANHELNPRAVVMTTFGDTPPVLADDTRLGQVFVNLLVNAAHALTSESVEGNRVLVSCGTDDRGWAFVEVRDNGCGMTAEVQGRIFDPFFTTKVPGKGTGLGLAICHGIVVSLGGEIQVESEVGDGSVFRVRLPPAPPLEEESQTEPLSDPPGQRGDILVIDDEPMVRAAIHRILGADHQLTMPDGARAAANLLKDGKRFDLILCDLMMPGLSGMDLHEEILRAQPEQARRIVFMSGGAFTTRSIEFLKSVPNTTIEKPFAPDEIKRRVRELIAELGSH